ncbi:MAG: CpsD/CapB family tyrosine-protein kinase, partial [Actinomycetota bacterium]
LPLAMGLALLLDSMTNTVRSKEEAEKIIGAETLGLIPLTQSRNVGYVVSSEEPYSAAAEAFRTLRINLESSTHADKRRFLITSPGAGEGKTTTIANLGVAFAEAGRSALLVSADLRRPRLHHCFDAEASPGFSDVLKDEAHAADLTSEVRPNLYLLSSGDPESRPDQLLNNKDLRLTFDNLSIKRSQATRPRNQENGTSNGRKRVSRVVGVQPQTMLIDAPPVLGAAEVSTLSAAVDGVIMVVQVGITGREAAARAAEQIRRSGGTIVGIVLVGVKSDSDYSFYGPEVDGKSSDSTWSKVVSSLQK